MRILPFYFFISSIGYTKIYQILSMLFYEFLTCHFWGFIVAARLTIKLQLLQSIISFSLRIENKTEICFSKIMNAILHLKILRKNFLRIFCKLIFLKGIQLKKLAIFFLSNNFFVFMKLSKIQNRDFDSNCLDEF